MHFAPFSATIPHIAYACLGGFVVFFGMFSLFIRERLYIGEACWAFLFGVIVGPYCANIFDPRGWGNGDRDVTNTITLEFTRVVLAIGVFAIGAELPKAYMKRHWKSLFFLLFPVMTWGWFVSAGLIYALIPKLNFLSSLAVAACLTPTDPILAAAVVGESGCNDGAAFPFLYIALYLTLDRTTGQAVEDWFLILWLYEVVLGVVIGALLGVGFRHLMKFCEQHDLIDRQSYVAQYVSLALLTIGVTTMLGSDDLLASFSCGTAFAWDGFFNKQTEESVFSSVIDLLFNVAAFVFVGAWTPFNQFSDPALSLSVWRLIVIAILVLLLRRLPAIIALYHWIPDVKNFREALFSGHFGPMGVGAVFISTLAAQTLPAPHDPPQGQQELLSASIQPIVAFMVVTSILIHGLSIPFFSLSRRVHTVSRTWSRRDTSTAPEWTTQTRRVAHPRDIVVNRDSAMERGDLRADVEEEKRDADADADEGYAQGERKESSEDTTTAAAGTPDADADAKAENPPDGDERVLEWKEGPHRIIERRGGPGDEVEVEVERNAYGPSGAERISHAFRGERPHARGAAGAFLKGLKHAPADVERGVESAARALEEAGAALEQRISPSSPGSSRAEDEEGWASDRQADSEGEDEGEGREKRRRWRKKPTVFVQGRTGRKQRPSIHRIGPPRAQPPPASDIAPAPASPPPPRAPSPALSQDDERARGRQASSASAAGSSQRRRPRHARIQSLRESEVRALRDASPARSVRFADEPGWGAGASGSGATTPRAGLSMPGSDDEGAGEEGEGTPSRVTFELPDVGSQRDADRRGE